jgi:hypothetical protein
MLAEWLTYFATPCPPNLKHLGYLHEIIGTRSRHRRCREAWEPHLANTRRMILEAAETAATHRKAVVYGSGWLLDIPLEELAQRFEDIVLVDVLHMNPVKRLAARHPNVRLATADLSGVIGSLDRDEIPSPIGDLPEDDADLLVSANLLTQLPYLPCEALRRRKPPPAEDEVREFAAAIIRHHLDHLAAAPGTVCLVTEIEHHLYEGKYLIERSDPLFGVDAGPLHRDWTWSLAPKPEIHRRHDLRCRVAARIESSRAYGMFLVDG